ncbi:hypothetical protein G4B88_025682 [Cannabis sativa]|uniref:Disease resistance protein At4g27190-like leucine-rich repeats domain-containing protein n=1 Tax=Cannabis sativa TaxID=3483 RepID=A0A7J6F457_CANSA|nr:hypothetical protein G4B88_025682 [Cannabis sativa]
MDMSNGDPNMWQYLERLHSVTLDHVTDINDQLKGLRQVRGLQQLHIWRCDSLVVIPNWITNSDLLRTFSIKLCPKLIIPRERLSLIATSKKLEIEDCPGVSHELVSKLSWMALEDLEPHPNLRELSISTYGGTKCNKCHCLPPLDHLPNLQYIVVDQTSLKTSFSSLKELRLTNLPELKRSCKDDSCDDATLLFTCLSKLVIEDCPSLTSMPLFPWLEELLVLKNTSWEPFKRSIMAAQGVRRIHTTSEFKASTSFSSNSPLSNAPVSPK